MQGAQPKRSGGYRRPTAFAEADRWLPDGQKVALNLRIGAHMPLDLVGDLIPGWAFDAGEQVVHLGVKVG